MDDARPGPARAAAAGALSGVAYYGPTLWWFNGFAVAGCVAIALIEIGMLAVAAGLVPAAHAGR